MKWTNRPLLKFGTPMPEIGLGDDDDGASACDDYGDGDDDDGNESDGEVKPSQDEDLEEGDDATEADDLT